MGEWQTAEWTCLFVPGDLKPLDPGMEWEKVSLSLSDDDSSDEENNNQDSEDEEYEGMENMQIEDWGNGAQGMKDIPTDIHTFSILFKCTPSERTISLPFPVMFAEPKNNIAFLSQMGMENMETKRLRSPPEKA